MTAPTLLGGSWHAKQQALQDKAVGRAPVSLTVLADAAFYSGAKVQQQLDSTVLVAEDGTRTQVLLPFIWAFPAQDWIKAASREDQLALAEGAWLVDLSKRLRAYDFPVVVVLCGESCNKMEGPQGRFWWYDPAHYSECWRRQREKMRSLGVTNARFYWQYAPGANVASVLEWEPADDVDGFDITIFPNASLLPGKQHDRCVTFRDHAFAFGKPFGSSQWCPLLTEWPLTTPDDQARCWDEWWSPSLAYFFPQPSTGRSARFLFPVSMDKGQFKLNDWSKAPLICKPLGAKLAAPQFVTRPLPTLP